MAILEQRKEEEQPAGNKEQQGGINSSAYAKLRDAATEAYTLLVEYGSTMDWSTIGKEQGSTEKKISSLFLSEARRKKLLDIGRSLWMTIRNNPELFNDSGIIPEEDESTVMVEGGSSLLFKDRQNKAVASGYARAIAARLIFVDYIDTRCSVGNPPRLHEANDRMDGADNTYRSTPSLQELVFGLKIFSRSGRTILEHDRKCAAYDLLSLASSCFEYISSMAESGNNEAAVGLKDSLDECFDALSLLPNAASLFGESRIEITTHDVQQDAIVKPWQTLVLNALEGAKSFIDRHCQSDMNSVHRQRYLPSVARLCCKHGAFFVKLCQYENAEKALSIALNSTNDCLNEIRQELENDKNRKLKGGRQALHNLEAELVVLSIEAFYLLSVTYQSSSKKEKAIICLDKIQSYMEEQHARDNELHSQVMTTLGSGKDFVFSERGSISSINHFEKDASDIKTRSIAALDDARSRHDAEKATLTFSRIMIFHKSIPTPSPEEESLIDKHIRDLVDLALCVSSSSTSKSSSSSKTKGHRDIFDMALRAIRQVHVRRKVSEMSVTGSEAIACADNYALFLDKSIKMNSIRRPFIMLDKLNAMLAIQYKVRERKCATKSIISRLDSEALLIAKEFIEMVTTFVGNGNSDTTLFVASNQSLSNELFQESKIHFARAVSLYHSLNAHHECAQWSDLLIHFLNLKQTTILSLEDSDVLLGQVMAVNAYAQSMSGSHAAGVSLYCYYVYMFLNPNFS
jgi:tetratricopeptide (TPR) repeat protein